jgi:hypothetical protein
VHSLFLLFLHKNLFVLFSGWMVFLRTVEWCPHGLSDEKTHSMNYAFFVACEPMINALWECHEITLFDMNPNPFVFQVADVKKT